MEEKNFGRFYAVYRFHDKIFYYDKRSLYLFNENNRLRKCIVWLVESSAFKFSILATVLANSILMASHSYEYRINPDIEKVTDLEEITGKIFVSIFLLEFILKTIAMGFIVKRNSYMRDGWNILDFVCLVTGILE